MHPLNMTTEELHAKAAEYKRLIRYLETKGAHRSPAECKQLKNTRALRREVMKVLSTREVQLRLI